MLKSVHPAVWAFDCEWVPDPRAAQVLFDLPDEASALEGMQGLWEQAGATPDDPEPYLKPLYCRVVAIASVRRMQPSDEDAPKVDVRWLPRRFEHGPDTREKVLLQRFLGAVEQQKPQLVGFNSLGADLRVLAQRALVHGLCLPGVFRRPAKPWEGTDYFARGGESHLDLMELAAGSGRFSAVSLHELALLCGIPGKPGKRDRSVARLWVEDRMQDIVDRCLYGAISTYLVWLRMAHLAGLFDTATYEREQELLAGTLEDLAADGTQLAARYLDDWNALGEDSDEGHV